MQILLSCKKVHKNKNRNNIWESATNRNIRCSCSSHPSINCLRKDLCVQACQSCLSVRPLLERGGSVCTQCASAWVWECRCVTSSMQNVSGCAYQTLYARRLSLHSRMCVSVCVGYVSASCWSMCAGTSTWRPCLTGPQCVRSDAKPTWQKQIMSAPVIFSSPSAPQEPFKGPNTDEITRTNTCTHMHVYSVDVHTHHAKQTYICKMMHLHAKCKDKHTFIMNLPHSYWHTNELLHKSAI